MSQVTYLFYDIETTGLDKSFDQVLQFAAIRTDLALNELSRHQFYVKLSSDVIPSPYASITHRISIAKAETGLTEFEAICKIHQLLNEPGTISCGYNTLGFDDEFLRFSFYRHLLPPYTHQYANSCGRMDLYPITVMYFLYQSAIIDWPKKDGKCSLKLADINETNHFVSGAAHNAMVDVEATLALARCYRKSPKMWDYLVGYFDKNINQQRFMQLVSSVGSEAGLNYRQALLIDGKFGPALAYQWPVLHLGQHTLYKNQSIFLRLDIDVLQLTNEKNIAEHNWVFRKKMGESGLLLPMKEQYTLQLSAERKECALRNMQWLQNNVQILESIATYHKQYTYPLVENIDVDAALYVNGFLSRDEEQLCQKFHQAAPKEKLKIIGLLKDKNLRTRAIRVMGRYYGDYLQGEDAKYFSNYKAKIYGDELVPIVNYKGGERLTTKKCLCQIKELREQGNLDLAQQELLNELEQYLCHFSTTRHSHLSVPFCAT